LNNFVPGETGSYGRKTLTNEGWTFFLGIWQVTTISHDVWDNAEH